MGEETSRNSVTNVETANFASSSSISPPSSSSINSVFGSVPTRAEANHSIAAFQSFMNHEGSRMRVNNPGFQPVETAFHFMRQPMVQEMVGSVMCDVGVIAAMLRNDAVQAFLRSLMLGTSTLRLTNGADLATATNIHEPQGSHNLVSTILSWLLDNLETGFQAIFGTLKSFVNNNFDESFHDGNTGPQSFSSNQVIYFTLFLAVINLMIVFVNRALKRRLVD